MADDKKINKNNNSELFEKMEQLKEAAYRDSLTGLLNRAAGEIYIQNILSRGESLENYIFMIIDLDNFKAVNDTLGHQAGDGVLQRVAKILSGIFRANDIVARLGGDEFMVFLYGDVTEAVANAKARAVCDNLQLSVGDEKKVFVSSSVGVYFSRGTEASFEQMYRIADNSLYQAKHKGKNQYFLSKSDIGERSEKEVKGQAKIKHSRAASTGDNSIAIIDNSESARLLYASPALCKMLGIRADNVTKHSLKEYIHSEDLDSFLSLAENPAQNKEVFVQLRFKSPAGEWFYTRVSASTVCCRGECIVINIYNIFNTIYGNEEPEQVKETGRTESENPNKFYWEIDLLKREIRFLGNREDYIPEENKAYGFPEEILDKGWIAAESVDSFIKFAAGIYTGRTRGYGNFLIKLRANGDFVWVTLSYRMQGDEHGVLYKAVGTTEVISTELSVVGNPYIKRKSLPMSVIDGLVVKLMANVTADSLDRIWIEGSFKTRDEMKLSAFTSEECRRIFDASSRQRGMGFFKQENLLKLYEDRCFWRFVEYRRVDGAGYIEWVNMAINLYKRVNNDDVYVRLSINNCDDRHIWESYATGSNIRNKETNLYTELALKEILEGMSFDAINQVCAAVMVRVDGLDKIYNCDEKRSRAVGEYVINMLSFGLGTGCIAARHDVNKYIFLFPTIRSREAVKQTMEQAFSYCKYLMSDIIPVNTIYFMGAVSEMLLKNADYDRLVASCEDTLEKFEPVGEDKLAFSAESRRSHFEAIDKKYIIDLEKTDRAFTQKEQKLFSDCLSDMLLATSADRALRALFRRLGSYHMADRVYLITLEDNSRDINVPCEWKKSELESIAIALSSTSIEKLQLLTRCILEKKPIGYYYQKPEGSYCEGEGRYWNYAVFPVSFSDKTGAVTDFLCLENPQKTDYLLVSRLIPYIRSKKLKAELSNENISSLNKRSFEALPNLHAYIDAVRGIAGKSYGGLGIISVKIPRLSILNSQYGFEYGNRMLRYVVDTITEVLGDKHLFRTWDNEFIVLIPNVVKNLVEEKHSWLKTVFERRYGKDMHVNYRWSESFSTKELMSVARVGVNSSISDIEQFARNTYVNSRLQTNINTKETDYKFTVYIQPVFEIKTNRLAGAEILARGVDSRGNIALPYKFVRFMEHNKNIKGLDLYVLDKALSLADSWRGKGYRQIPLSVNFSKTTILDNTILASYLAVRSRYPDLSDYKIGIEIPQNIYAEDYDRLLSVMEQLREFSTLFIIDDVGVDEENTKILNKIRFDAVKIDHSLVIDTAVSESTREMIRAIANLCIRNKTECVAEGVETREQLNVVRRLGCSYAQGVCYAKPMPVAEFVNRYLIKDK